MEKKTIILLIVIAIVIAAAVFIGIRIFSNSNEIKTLLYEKYKENFKIVHDSGKEYKSGLFPTFQKTGYKNVIAAPENNTEVKFNVRLKLDPMEIVEDDYIPAIIAYNTSKEIEKKYKIGNKMYVHTLASEYKCDGKTTDTFFENIKGRGSIYISIYVEGADNRVNYKDYLNKIIKDLNFDSSTTGSIRLYFVKEKGTGKIKNYYKNSKDMVKVENSANSIKKDYFETPNKDYFINF